MYTIYKECHNCPIFILIMMDAAVNEIFVRRFECITLAMDVVGAFLSPNFYTIA